MDPVTAAHPAGTQPPGLELTIEPLDLAAATALAADLLAMNAESGWDTWDRDNLLADRPEKWARSLLARNAGEPVGYAVASRRPDSVHLHHLVVSPMLRSRGVGQLILDELLARSADVGVLTLKVHPDNAGALRFYRKAGFAQRGTSSTGYLEFARSC